MNKTKKMRQNNKRRTKKMRRHRSRKNKIGGMPTGKKTTTHKTHKRNTPHKTHAGKTRTTSLHPKSQSHSQSMDDYFLNGTQSSEEKSQIIGIVSSSGLSQNTQDNIFNSIHPNATVDDVKQEVDELNRITHSPFIEIDGNKSVESTHSYQEVVTWGNHHPSITKETLDASMPEPLSFSELKSATPDLESQQVKPTTLFELIQSSFKNKYKYDLSLDEYRLLECLTSENYLEMHQLLYSFFETKEKDGFELLDPSNFDMVVLVHGQTDPKSPPIDMNDFPNIEMHMVVPETIVVNVEFNPNPKHGERGYDDIVNKAFNNDLFVFSKYGKDKTRFCPPMLQGVSRLDTDVAKEAMGFYMRLDDGTLFKIADFNCTYKYAEYRTAHFGMRKSSMHPDDANMRFNYSLMFISKLARLISNILKGAPSEHDAGAQPLLKITQLSCRPYLLDAEISPNIKNIWTALLMLGNTNVAIIDGYVTLNTNTGADFVSKGHSLSPQYSASQSASVRQQPDEQSKLDYVVEKIKSIASRILRIKSYSGIREDVKTRQKIKIIHELIRYIKMINFEFAKRGLPVPDGATMLSTLDDRDEYPDEFWLEDKPYAIGSPSASATQSQSSLKDAEDCEWDDCGNPSQEDPYRVSSQSSAQSASQPIIYENRTFPSVSSQAAAAAAARPPTIKQAWTEKPPSPIHSRETNAEQKRTKKQRTRFSSDEPGEFKFLPEEPGAYLGSSSADTL